MNGGDQAVGLVVEDWLDACDKVDAAKVRRATFEARLGELVPRAGDSIEFVHRRLIPDRGWQVIRVSRTRGGDLVATASPIPGSGDVRWPVAEFLPPAVADAVCDAVCDAANLRRDSVRARVEEFISVHEGEVA